MSTTETDYEAVETIAPEEAKGLSRTGEEARSSYNRHNTVTEDGKGILSPREGKLLEWCKLDYTVTDRRGGEIRVLQDNFGRVPPGQVAALMGPSGAGKSSLLNVLAGRIAPNSKNSITGVVKVGGKQIDTVANRSNVAYVMQDDAIMPTTTPREALTFSARLRLPSTMPVADTDALVSELLEELGLEDCADTKVGGDLFPGISGGQRKRTSVGVDLISNPSMLFLDEPTSGLDSFSAEQVVELLKKVAEAGATVVCTIHQPSSEVFSLFNVVILLRSGRVVFDGSREGMNDFFALAGHVCPRTYNLADYVMFVMDDMTVEDMEKQGLFMEPPESDDKPHEQGTGSSSMTVSTKNAEFEKESAMTRFFVEMKYLGIRELQYTSRNHEALGARFGSPIFLNFLYALVFLGVGQNDDSDDVNFNDHIGGLAFVTISCMFDSAIPVALEFPIQRPIFLREYAVGSYGAASYFFSKLPIELGMAFVNALIVDLITYWLIGFRGRFDYFLLAWWGLDVAAASFAIILGCSVSDVKSIPEFLPPIIVPQLFFAGFFVRIEDIPVYVRWGQWLCGLKYTLNLVYLNEFSDEQCSEEEAPRCEGLLEVNEVEPELFWLYIVLLILLIIAFRIFALFVLVQRAKTVY